MRVKACSFAFHKLDLVYMKTYTGRMASERGTKSDSSSVDLNDLFQFICSTNSKTKKKGRTSSAGSTNASHAIMTRYGEEVQDVAY